MLLSRIQDIANGIDWAVSVDSPAVRAHQHAASARRTPPATVPHKGTGRGTTRSIRCFANWPPGWRRWSDLRIPGQHCLGGSTANIHLAAEGRCRPLAFVLTPRHYGDRPQVGRVLAQGPKPKLASPHTAQQLPGGRGLHISQEPPLPVPTRTPGTNLKRLDQQKHRRSRKSGGGRPTAINSERYKKATPSNEPTTHLKDFRAIATRYEKRAYVYLGSATLAALTIWLRT